MPLIWTSWGSRDKNHHRRQVLRRTVSPMQSFSEGSLSLAKCFVRWECMYLRKFFMEAFYQIEISFLQVYHSLSQFIAVYRSFSQFFAACRINLSGNIFLFFFWNCLAGAVAREKSKFWGWEKRILAILTPDSGSSGKIAPDIIGQMQFSM